MMCEFCGYKDSSYRTFMKHGCRVKSGYSLYCGTCDKKMYSDASRISGYCSKCDKKRKSKRDSNG